MKCHRVPGKEVKGDRSNYSGNFLLVRTRLISLVVGGYYLGLSMNLFVVCCQRSLYIEKCQHQFYQIDDQPETILETGDKNRNVAHIRSKGFKSGLYQIHKSQNWAKCSSMYRKWRLFWPKFRNDGRDSGRRVPVSRTGTSHKCLDHI